MKRKLRKTRLTADDINTIRDMQRDLDYLKQFVVNVPALLMGMKPAILISCSEDVEMLCDKCWDECLKAYDKVNNGKGDD